MDSENRQQERGESHRGGWYFIKGIPVAVIVTLVLTLGGQSLAFVLYLKGIETRVENVSEKQIEHGRALDKTNDKLDRLVITVQEGNTPSAINAARISSLETAVSDIKGRVAENERLLIRMQAAQNATDMRSRAARER